MYEVSHGKSACYLAHTPSRDSICVYTINCRGKDVSDTLRRMASMPSECDLLEATTRYDLTVFVDLPLLGGEEKPHERNGQG